MTIRFNNYSKLVDQQSEPEYYNWRVFVDEPPEVLDQIVEVEYLLHKSFPQPYQVRRNREENFALETAGWGEFMLLIEVRFVDGKRPPENLKYRLVLDPNQKPWPEPAAQE